MPIIVSSSSSMRQWFWSVPPTDAPYSLATVERFSGAHDVAMLPQVALHRHDDRAARRCSPCA